MNNTGTARKRTLKAAAEAGHLESIQYHLARGADVNQRLKSGHFPLAGAARYGHANAVRLLLEHGAKVDMRTERRWTPLFIAAWYGHYEAAQVLLLAGANPNLKVLGCDYIPAVRTGFTALRAAIYRNDSRLAELLLQYGAKPEELESPSQVQAHKAGTNR